MLRARRGAPKHMATQLEVQQRQSYARALLEKGIRNGSVATMLSARFHISRSTAYNDIAAAHAEIDLSDDAPATEELEEHSVDSTIAQLQHLFDVACATGDTKGAAALITAMDKAKRWNGTLQATANPYA